MAAMGFGLLQWGGTHLLAEMQAPARKETESEIRGIRRDTRTVATLMLESQRYTRSALKNLSEAQGIELTQPPELIEAEAEVRKLHKR